MGALPRYWFVCPGWRQLFESHREPLSVWRRLRHERSSRRSKLAAVSGDQRPREGWGAAGGSDTSPESAPAGSERRIGRTLSAGWRLAKIAYRDPEHVAERIALHSTQSLGEPSLEWAQRVREEREGVPRAVIAEQLRTDSAKIAAIDGAIAGTPFLIALVPGYLVYLRQEARMLLRIAALYDRDPRALETAAEMLALRGVDPTVDAARTALLAVQDAPLPEKPTARRPWRTWVRCRLRPADLRRVPLRPLRQEQGGGPSVGEDRAGFLAFADHSGWSPACSRSAS